MRTGSSFLSRLRDIPLALRVGKTWIRALELASEKKHQEVLQLIAALPERVRCQLSWSILELQQNAELAREGVSISQATALLPRLEASRLRTPVKIYLTAYVKWMASRATRNSDARASTMFDVDWTAVSLAEVPKYWMRRFPLRAHPEWSMT